MRNVLVALLLVAACKDSKPATPSPSAAPTSSTSSSSGAPRPQLPGGPAAEREAAPGSADEDLARDEIVGERGRWRERRDDRRKMLDERLDTNHDGIISDEERMQRLAPMRDRLDADHDGKLTPDELAASGRRMAFADPAQLDTNHDGDISLAELDTAVRARRDQMRERFQRRQEAGAMPGAEAHAPKGSASN